MLRNLLKKYRTIITWLLLIVSLFVLSQLSVRLILPKQTAVDDYIEYWSAAVLNLNGGNPYEPGELLPLQLSVGRVIDPPVMMWNPPWTLTLVMPFAFFNYPFSRLLWFIGNTGVIFVCINYIWDLYGGAREKRWLACLLGFTFGPMLLALKFGQISPLFLLGLVGFLYSIYRQNTWLAGFSIALLMIKPHVVYLFFLALFLWAMYERKWPILLSGFAALCVFMGVTYLVNPSIINQYIYASSNYPPKEFATATIGGILRYIMGPEKVWLQFIPTIFGSFWFLYYFFHGQKYRNWQWTEELPLLCLVSMATSTYGWVYDQTIFLFALLQGLVWAINSKWTLLKVGFLSLYVFVNYLLLAERINQLWFWWLAPLSLIVYLSFRRSSRNTTTIGELATAV